jgi:PPK2 family polyphosphate:nucleotide phosphotransferase
MKHAKLIKHFRIDDPKRFRLADFDPGDTAGLDINKAEAKTILADDIEHLTGLQQRLYAEHRRAVLVVLQGIDAAGKDSVIKHAMSGLDPQGCEVHPFKAPTSEELDHDFLWRAARRLPGRGRIGIFNRSYYEEVLVVRVHKELLDAQHLPPEVVGRKLWKQRFKDINAFERHLVRSGTTVIKFHLRISKAEQKRRLLERLDDPAKRWKFAEGDIAERKLWDRHMAAYEDMIRNTSTPEAPWYVVPADNKWFARLVVAGVMVDVLERLRPEFPKIDRAGLRKMKQIRKALMAKDQ